MSHLYIIAGAFYCPAFLVAQHQDKLRTCYSAGKFHASKDVVINNVTSYSYTENHHEGEIIRIHLSEEVSFLNKASIKKTLDDLPHNSTVIIDAGNSHYIDFDVLELIKEFKDIQAVEKNITCILTGFKEHYKIDNTHNVLSESRTKGDGEDKEAHQHREKPVYS